MYFDQLRIVLQAIIGADKPESFQGKFAERGAKLRRVDVGVGDPQTMSGRCSKAWVVLVSSSSCAPRGLRSHFQSTSVPACLPVIHTPLLILGLAVSLSGAPSIVRTVQTHPHRDLFAESKRGRLQ